MVLSPEILAQWEPELEYLLGNAVAADADRRTSEGDSLILIKLNCSDMDRQGKEKVGCCDEQRYKSEKARFKCYLNISHHDMKASLCVKLTPDFN